LSHGDERNLIARARETSLFYRTIETWGKIQLPDSALDLARLTPS
jgi:hypothetical protein